MADTHHDAHDGARKRKLEDVDPDGGEHVCASPRPAKTAKLQGDNPNPAQDAYANDPFWGDDSRKFDWPADRAEDFIGITYPSGDPIPEGLRHLPFLRNKLIRSLEEFRASVENTTPTIENTTPAVESISPAVKDIQSRECHPFLEAWVLQADVYCRLAVRDCNDFTKRFGPVDTHFFSQLCIRMIRIMRDAVFDEILTAKYAPELTNEDISLRTRIRMLKIRHTAVGARRVVVKKDNDGEGRQFMHRVQEMWRLTEEQIFLLRKIVKGKDKLIEAQGEEILRINQEILRNQLDNFLRVAAESDRRVRRWGFGWK